jgi:hypothetical protein
MHQMDRLVDISTLPSQEETVVLCSITSAVSVGCWNDLIGKGQCVRRKTTQCVSEVSRTDQVPVVACAVADVDDADTGDGDTMKPRVGLGKKSNSGHTQIPQDLLQPDGLISVIYRIQSLRDNEAVSSKDLDPVDQTSCIRRAALISGEFPSTIRNAIVWPVVIYRVLCLDKRKDGD